MRISFRVGTDPTYRLLDNLQITPVYSHTAVRERLRKDRLLLHDGSPVDRELQSIEGGSPFYEWTESTTGIGVQYQPATVLFMR